MTQATCPEGHPLFVCRLCELIFEGGLADPLPDGSVRCPQCLMGETDPFAGPVPDDAITHASRFT